MADWIVANWNWLIDWVLLFGTWLLYGIVELVSAWLRKRWSRDDSIPRPKLISPNASEFGWKMNALVYVHCGMATHWWWSADWKSTAAALVFWLIIPVLLAFDIAVWNKPLTEWPVWMRWTKWPVWYMVLGALNGRFLFPQNGPMPWDWDIPWHWTL